MQRLRDCAAKLREHVRKPGVSLWLKDNHSLLQSQISDLRHTLRPSFLRKLHQTSEGEPAYLRHRGRVAGERTGCYRYRCPVAVRARL